MSSNSRSIGQRLAKAKAPGLKAEIAQDWARNWEEDQTQVLRRLEQAHKHKNWHGIGATVAQLRAITDKRFFALPNVISKLSEAFSQLPKSDD